MKNCGRSSVRNSCRKGGPQAARPQAAHLDTLEQLKQLARAAGRAPDHGSLRGIEGTAAARFEQFWNELNQLIDEEEDSLLAYCICRDCVKKTLSAGSIVRPVKAMLYIL